MRLLKNYNHSFTAGNFRIRHVLKLLALILFLAQCALVNAQNAATRFAVFGDFGSGDQHEQDVANLVKSWNPEFIVTVGDNNYPDGEAATIDANVGQFYHDFIFPYTGIYGAGATTNRFFPALGNHDWINTFGAPAQPYFDYFTLPGNERYYDFVRGPVHFFVLDSDPREPDGIDSNLVQGVWLQNKLAASTAQWKIVCFHHTPYSSRTSTVSMQWQFQQWGATAVIAGHAHLYERVMKNGFPYFTNGLGGESTGTFGAPIAGSVVRYGEDYGAQLIVADDNTITFQFITQSGTLIDRFTISNLPLVAPGNLTAAAASGTQVNLAWSDNATNEDGFKIEQCQTSGCTNFTEIAQTAANVSTYSDSGRAANTVYRYRVRAFNSSGDSAYSNSVEVMTGDPPSTLFTDDFNDGTRDATKWNVGLFSRVSTYFDAQIPVAEQNGGLSITPRASMVGNFYSGYVSAATWNLTDSSAAIEVVQKTSGNAVTIFSAGTDKDNWFSFRAKGSTLYFESRKAGTTTSSSISYSSAQHRFWRIRHNPVDGTIVFETSADGAAWTIRRTVARQITITAVKIEVIAGTGESVSTPGAALFDNFRFAASNSIFAPPLAPSALAATAFSSNQINLSWTDNSNDEDKFLIERCLDANCMGFTEIAQVVANTTTYSNLGLSSDRVYRYRVRSEKSGAVSAYSNTAEMTTPLPPLLPPIAPSNLVATPVSTVQINLTWSVNSENEDGFKIERCQNAGCADFAEIGQVGIDVSFYADAGRAAGTTYRYRIRAFNSNGSSVYSNTSETATQSQIPLPPSNLTVTAASSVQINLAWTDNADNETGFKIERCQNSGCANFAEIAQVATNTVAYSDTGRAAGTTYRYRVRASNSGGNSAFSEIAETITNPETAAFSDNFDDGVIDVAKWSIGLFSRTASNFDASIQVSEQNGQLSIAPLAGTTGGHYSGYLSAATWNLTDSAASVEVAQKTAGNAATIFSVGIDKDNWFGFRAKGGTLYFESRKAGTTTSTSIGYSATQHRFWRLRHDKTADTIAFETSADGAAWMTRQTVARQITITAVKIELIAGTGESVAAPGAALFDNFRLDANAIP